MLIRRRHVRVMMIISHRRRRSAIAAAGVNRRRRRWTSVRIRTGIRTVFKACVATNCRDNSIVTVK